MMVQMMEACEICDKYAKVDTRIIVIHQNNSGSVYMQEKSEQKWLLANMFYMLTVMIGLKR